MAVDVSAVARVIGIDVEYVDMRGDRAAFLPQRLAVFAQGATASSYSLAKKRILSASEAGSTYGFGSPIHLICRELFPENGDGVGTIPVTVYPLEDAYDAGTPSVGTITPLGTQTKTASYRIRAGGIVSQRFTITPDDSVGAACDKIVAACNAVVEFPAIASDGATDVDFTSKWAGESANELVLELIGDTFGMTFGITQPTGGAANPDVTGALALVGNVWETMMLNAMNSDDEDALDAFQAFGDGRWSDPVPKPPVVFVGNTDADFATATATTSTRTDDRVNSQLTAPGSPTLPFIVAARQVARIVRQANNNPPKAYGAKRIDRVVAGVDSEQWDYATRDAAIKAGSSTVEVVDGVITIGNIVTMYRPAGESPPAYADVSKIVRLQNVIYNYDLRFGSEDWAAAPLIPDDQPTVNPEAKKPKSALAESALILDGLGEAAIISDPDTAKKNQTASIDADNPDRLNLTVPIQLSGNTNVKNVEIRFGFYFGGAVAA